jgi:hypothetical protein
MQTLALEITTTFFDDAAALALGCLRLLISPLMAPVDRLARACDVGGVLERRRANGRRNCVFSLRGLADLT